MTEGDEEPEGDARPSQGAAEAREPESERSSGLGEVEHVELLPASGPMRPIFRTIGLAEQVIGAALIAVILVLVLIQVAQRYTPFGGWPWTGEVARLALVWCTFAVSGYLMAQDRHITIRVIDLVLGVRALAVTKLFAHIVVAATCIGMAYATFRLIADDIGQRTPAAEIPVTVVYVLPLIGFVLTAVRAVMAIGLVDAREVLRGEEQPS